MEERIRIGEENEVVLALKQEENEGVLALKQEENEHGNLRY